MGNVTKANNRRTTRRVMSIYCTYMVLRFTQNLGCKGSGGASVASLKFPLRISAFSFSLILSVLAAVVSRGSAFFFLAAELGELEASSTSLVDASKLRRSVQPPSSCSRWPSSSCHLVSRTWREESSSQLVAFGAQHALHSRPRHPGSRRSCPTLQTRSLTPNPIQQLPAQLPRSDRF